MQRGLIKNFDWCAYTYKHRRAFVYVARRLIRDEKLLEKMLLRARVHDMDKMLLYLFLDQTESQQHHVQTMPHHLDNDLPKTYEDLVETVIDFECAPYTKPDKPLNAYDFTAKLQELGYLDREMADRLGLIMHEFGIDASYQITDEPEAMAFVHGMGEVTEAMIWDEISGYVNHERKSAAFLELLSYLKGRLLRENHEIPDWLFRNDQE